MEEVAPTEIDSGSDTDTFFSAGPLYTLRGLASPSSRSRSRTPPIHKPVLPERSDSLSHDTYDQKLLSVADSEVIVLSDSDSTREPHAFAPESAQPMEHAQVLASGNSRLFVSDRPRLFVSDSLRIPPGLLAHVQANPDITLCLPGPGKDPMGHACSLVRRVSHMPFYIGITENPVARWGDHCIGGWDAMYVLFQARSSSDTADLERRLIAKFSSSLMCHNVGLGGERASRGSPHFCYVVYKYSTPPLLRRAPRQARNAWP